MKSLLGLAVIPALILGCVTVNLNFNFPEKELHDKLMKQEKELWGTDKTDEKTPTDMPKAIAFDPVPVPQDDKVDLKVKNPAIEKINEERQTRFKELKGYFSTGWIGEGNDGLLHERETGDITPKEKARFKKLVQGENDDREKLLKEILKANNLDENAMEKVRRVWSVASKAKCLEGWWIQTRKSTWKKKTREDVKKLDEGKDVEE